MRKLTLTHFLLFITNMTLLADESQWLLHRYDERNSQLQGHATMLLRDHSGFFWISTWNGLCRFDGYEFLQLKPQAGDGCSMSTDRLRDIWLAENGDIYCHTDDGTYRFDIRTYRFNDLKNDDERQQAEQQRHRQPTRGMFRDKRICYTDSQGLKWLLVDDALSCYSTAPQPTIPLDIQPTGIVRCLFQDSKSRIWLATREDAAIRIYDRQLQLIGYLSADGLICRSYTSFGSPVYCMAETDNGTLWLGCKPDGLFRLREQQRNTFSVDFIDKFDDYGIYDIKPDQQHQRLWIATLGGGLCCVQNISATHPQIVKQIGDYPTTACQRVRNIHTVGPDYLIATTTEGLVVGRLNTDLNRCQFHRHVKEPLRPTSLSCNATMEITQDAEGHLYVSTETGGICQFASNDLWSDTLCFRNYDLQSGHLPTDLTIAIAPQPDGRLLVTSQTQFMLLDPTQEQSENFGHHFFHQSYRFSEVRPLRLDDGRWLFATTTGAFTLEKQLARKSNYQPPLALTAISIQGGQQNLAANALDTLLLSPSERNLTIRFAALDYAEPEAIRYQYRMGEDTTAAWINLGHEHALTLLDLDPGTYKLALRSTNADGQWTNNMRQLTIIVQPTFWETPWATLLILLTITATLAAIGYTLLYIRRIKHQQRETLEAYLALLNKPTLSTLLSQEPQPTTTPGMKPEDDALMKRIMKFVDANLSNSDANIGDMATAAATSRSGLQRKLKQTMGITPQDLLREARIKRACQLLVESNKSISEVAYACGFTDPKYFSRCFKQSTGKSPSDYKSAI